MTSKEKSGLLLNRRSAAMPISIPLTEIVEITNDVIIIFNVQGNIILWNLAAERLYGWDADEAIDKTSDEPFWPLYPTFGKDQEELDFGKTIHGEYRTYRKDGTELWVEYSNRAMLDANREFLGYISIHRDITEHKRVLEELKWNRAFVENIGQATPDILFVFDLEEKQVIYTNRRIETMLGYSVEQLEAMSDVNTKLLHPDDLIRMPSLSENISESADGEILKGEYRLRANDNSYHWMSVHFTVFQRAPDGEPKQIIGNASDITERKQIEGEIGLVAKMPAENPNPVMRLTPDGRVVYANNASSPLLDFWKQQTGQVISDEIRKGIKDAFESGSKKEFEVRYDGKVLTCILTPIRESGFVNLYGTDITDRKRAEKTLLQARARAERVTERIIRLQSVTAALSESMTPLGVAEVLVMQGIPALDATRGTVMSLTEDGLSLEILHASAPEELTRPYQRFPITLNVPAADALRSGVPIWIQSRQEYKERYPHLEDQIEAWKLEAAAAIPLVTKGHKLGVLTLSFEQVREFTSEDQDFALNLAQQAAQALDRAFLYRKMLHALSELQMTYDQSPIGMIQLDTDLRYVRVNETLAKMNGIPAAEHIGKSIYEIVPDLASVVGERFRDVIKTGKPVYNLEVLAETKAEPGVPHTWLESWYPLRDETGEVIGLNIVVQDITNRKKDERSLGEFARQQEALYKLADRLHRTNSLDDTFDAALDAILNALQCDRASILLFDDANVMRFMAWRGLSSAYRKATDGHSPWKIDEKKPVPIYYNEIDSAELDDALKVTIRSEGIASLAFIPLVFDGKLIGKFMTYFDAPHTFSVNEIDLGLTIAHQLAFGIQRLRAEEALRTSEARLAVELADEKQLQIISSLLIQEDNIELLYEEILSGAMAIMGSDMGSLQMLDNENKELLLLASKGFHPGSTAFWQRVNLDSSSSCGKALYLGRRVMVPDVETADFMAGTDDLKFSRLSGIRSVQTTPLVSRNGGIVGMISTHWRKPHQPSERELGMLNVLIRQAADLIERKQATQALRENEKQLQSLNESLEHKVAEQTTEVRKLASDLTKAEQRERQRIAHILHEDLQQRFYALQMNIEFLLEGLVEDNSILQKERDQIRQQMRDVMAITRHLSVDLSPPILRDEGLTQAVDWLASQMQEQYDLQIQLKADESFAIPDEDIQLLLFSCIRELLFNVVKHADAKKAVISLERSNGKFQVEVRDDGIGFDVNKLRHQSHHLKNKAVDASIRSFGISTIHHRLNLFGGQMDIRSAPNAGTVISITIPIQH